ncbi:TRAP-type mannitol/chloroaromatic compound transport system permease small subunit [Rubricella aquisinus]|uniref:TRAP transporter small permease protein n=1 Tax=Rubricella aquisinus TaxID=2028108 RepID=A0A840WH71_9RHOB|nr:TRAP transporter small permease [Rubricella aquisinus]MBB5514468.1 TRAP-type mannitol/chloroaromatic compound transport system permease small subunit [Rubricella aquisinus]
MRRFLDRLYAVSGALAALSIVGICLIVTAQVLFNLVARIMGPGWSYTIPSYADFAGFMLAAATFLALAYTLRHGAHIRVTLVSQTLPKAGQFVAELICFVLGLIITGYAFYYFVLLVWESWHFGDKSPGIIAVPLWIPQTAAAVGLGILVIALIDSIVESLRAKAPILGAGEEV